MIVNIFIPKGRILYGNPICQKGKNSKPSSLKIFSKNSKKLLTNIKTRDIIYKSPTAKAAMEA